MTPTSAQESAAQFLFAARTNRTTVARIPEDVRPATIDDALAIQRRVVALVGQPIGGWKCSVPSAARPVLAAPIFAPAIKSASPCAAMGRGGMLKIEPEIAFVIGKDLPARATPYSEAEVRDEIREARFVLELMGARYTDPSAVDYTELLADSVANQGLFVGPVLAHPWERALEAFPVTIAMGGAVLAQRDGKHPDGHPLRPLYWLANWAAQQGTPLTAGQIVTTGSYCGVVEVPIGPALTVTYGDLGTLAVTLAPAQ